MTITAEQLKAIAFSISDERVSKFLEPLNTAMDKFGITSAPAQAMFLAQVMHESGECRYVLELASGTAYEGRKDLGNTSPGDGVKYKGRGLIQITGKLNYIALGKVLVIDCVTNPSLVEDPTNAAMSAAWYWNCRGLTAIAEGNTETAFKLVTKKINGGYNGYDDRLKYWIRAKKALNIT